jgi:preprotein translocase subunit SecD
MERSWIWRLVLVLGICGWAVYQATPTFLYLSSEPEVRRSRKLLKERIPDSLPDARMNLGIDLQGGLHLVMGVDTERAVLNRADRVADEVVEQMKDKQKPLKGSTRREGAPIVDIELASEADWATLKEFLDNRSDTWDVLSHSGTAVSWGMKPEYVNALKEDAVAQAIKTLRNRIDVYGVTEPEVRKSGTNSVLIQIAGLTADEEQSVKEEIIGKTAQLEFKIADDESKYFLELASSLPPGVKLDHEQYEGPGGAIVTVPYLVAKTREELQAAMAVRPPPSDKVVSYSKIKTPEGDRFRTWLLNRKTPLTGDSIVNAFAAFNNDENRYYVALKLDRPGGAIFDQLTAANVRKRVAIVLDDIVDSAPVIQSRIPDGNVSITLGGAKTQQEILKEAQALSVVLNAGALPAPVYPQEERTVGSTLGDDAVQKGKLAMIASAICTILVMVLYYRLSGAISIFAMSVNMLLLFAALAAFNATLTLPGLAGLALTIGMAVDANVVQFERIRDELRLGKTVRAAVDAGFDKAFSAIFDSNVTTLLSAIVLYQYGSGPIRGFATTLGVGVVINTFSAVVVPRLVLDYVARVRRTQQLSI